MQQNNYGSIAKFLHWGIGVMVIFNYILGLTLDSTSWYELHKQVGLTILVLMILRLIWRLISHYPKELPELSFTEKVGAVGVQILLYLLLFMVPLGGILLVQAHGYNLNLWEIIKVPSLISSQPHEVAHNIKELHEWGAHFIIILVCLHVAAALWHHFVRRDRVLLRMLPFAKR